MERRVRRLGGFFAVLNEGGWNAAVSPAEFLHRLLPPHSEEPLIDVIQAETPKALWDGFRRSPSNGSTASNGR